MARRKLVRFNAVRTEKKPVRVKFRTKDGRTVSFKATKVIKKKKPVRFYARK